MASLHLRIEREVLWIYEHRLVGVRGVVEAEVYPQSLEVDYRAYAPIGIANRQRIVERCCHIVTILDIGGVETSRYESSRVEGEV